MMSAKNKCRTLIFCAGLLWSMAGLFIKSIHLPAPAIAVYRSLFAAVIFLPFLRGALASIPWNGYTFTAILSYTGIMATFVTANKLTFAANAIVLQYTAPFFIPLLKFIPALKTPPRRDFDERQNVFVWIGCAVGILIILFGQGGTTELTGILLSLCSAIFFATYIVASEHLTGVSSIALVFLCNFFAAGLIAIFAQPDLWISSENLLLLFLAGAIQLGTPYVLFNSGLKEISAQEAALIVMIEPVLNPIWVALNMNEIPPATSLIGGALILTMLFFRYFLALKKSP